MHGVQFPPALQVSLAVATQYGVEQTQPLYGQLGEFLIRRSGQDQPRPRLFSSSTTQAFLVER